MAYRRIISQVRAVKFVDFGFWIKQRYDFRLKNSVKDIKPYGLDFYLIT